MSRHSFHTFLRILAGLLLLAGVWGCSVVRYSFSGTSIQPDVKTITINFFVYPQTPAAEIGSTTDYIPIQNTAPMKSA